MEINRLCSGEMLIKVESVKKLLQEDSSVDMTTVGEYLIIIFLYSCKCDVKKSQEKLLTYFKYRKQFPKMLKAADPLDDHIQSIYQNCILTTDINQEELESPLVAVVNLANAGSMNIYDGSNLLVYVLRMAICHSERARKHGLSVIVNAGDMSYSLLLQFTPTFLYQTVKTMLCVSGDLVKKYIIINAGVFVSVPIRAFRMLLPESFKEIFAVYSGSWECLKDDIPSESLPIEYGGTNGTVEENNG
ncbi:hypothetical protein CHUAL_002833 [Chamberlinius hualienensis]